MPTDKPAILTVDVRDSAVDKATGMVSYECPGCGATRHLDRGRWDDKRASQSPLRCLACDTVYRLPALPPLVPEAPGHVLGFPLKKKS